MLRKWICLIGAACMVMAVVLPADAAGGAIRVMPQCCGNPITGGSVSICRVGDKTEGGYQITDGLANWTVTEEDILSNVFLKHVQSDGVARTVGRVGTSGVLFSDLQEGVYLICQEESAPGYFPFAAFAVCISPEDTDESVFEPKLIRISELPNTGDHPAPIIGAMGIGLSAAVLMVLIDERKK